MKRVATRFPAFPLVAVLAACGGGSEEMGESSMEGDAQMAESGAATAAGLDCYLAGATLEEAQQRVSPHTALSFSYDGGEGLLCYGAPSARGREIMGGLVPYGAPWRIGADEPTTIHLSAPASVGGVELEPGSYSLYAVPAEGDWEFFVNTNWQRWGIPINADVRESEIGSFMATPEASESAVETLTYRWEDGALVMAWENTEIRIPVEGM